jgi:Tfp pilus assembly protein PilO
VLGTLTQKAATLTGLDEFELERKTEVLLRILPPEKDVANLLSTFKFLSLKEGVTIKDIKIDPQQESPTMLNIEGEKEKIMDFLRGIVTTCPLMKLESVTFSFPKSGSLIEAKIVVQNFFQQLPESLGRVESPLLPITPEEEKSYEEVSNFNPVLIEKELEPVQTGKENPFL